MAVLGDSQNFDYRFRATFLITYPTRPLRALCVKVDIDFGGGRGGWACESTMQKLPFHKHIAPLQTSLHI